MRLFFYLLIALCVTSVLPLWQFPTPKTNLRQPMAAMCDYEETSGYDPMDRWRQVTVSGINPFTFCNGNQFNVINVPDWRWSVTKNRKTWGGFTADMGWVLMMARYTLQQPNDVITMQFPEDWGHGAGGWEDMFEPISPKRCIDDSHHVHNWDYKDDNDRRKVKMYHLYDKPAPRNLPVLTKGLLDNDIPADNDLQTMRYVFSWVFRLRPDIQRQIDSKSIKIQQPYIGVHVRWGDKVGERAGPKESSKIPLQQYSDWIRCYGNGVKTVFVASDDYRAVRELRQLLGTDFTVFTLTDPTKRGFSIVEYHGHGDDFKLRESVDMWTDMSMLAQSTHALVNMESSIGKTVHLMRLGKPANTTINMMNTYRKSKSCCSKGDLKYRLRDCFWLCT